MTTTATKSDVRKIPKLRFPGFSGEWEEKRLGDVFSKKQERNTDNKLTHVLTNSAVRGIVDQSDYFDKEIANQDNLTNYFIVDLDDFIYNPRISNFAPVGPLKRNTLIQGIMSPLYTVLKPKKGNLTFFEKYFDTAKWHGYMYKIANYGARHDRMNILQSDLLNMPLPFPEIAEQQKIADFLTSTEKWIETLRTQKEILLSYKEGMMQKIFAQEIRFNDEGGKEFTRWEETELGKLGSFYRGHSYTLTDVADEGLLVLRSSNIQNDRLQINKDLQFVKKDCGDEVLLQKNDLAICMANGSKNLVGKAGRYLGDYEGRITVGAFCSIFRSKFILSQYLFQTKRYKKHLQIALGGTNINNLKNSELAKFKFNFPTSKVEQQKIADFLTSIDKLIESKIKQITLAEQWKKGLMQNLFV